jgi:hypothetical protein
MNDVDLALILLFDASASVTFESFGLIASGTAAALRDPVVAQALLAGPRGSVLCALVLFSATGAQEVMIDWTRIAGTPDLEAFAQAVEDVPRAVPAGATAIGAALIACETLLRAQPAGAARQVIDVAGDGRSNEGPDCAAARDRLVDAGVVINGLCILHEEADLLESYTREVIGGLGAFALPCADYTVFAVAMRQKLRQEIA